MNPSLQRLLSSTCLSVVVAVGGTPSFVFANPIDGQVVAGSATITETGKKLDVVQGTDRAVIDWRGFDIAPDEHTQFYQPTATSIALNRVTSADPSVIAGKLSANGNVILINPNGVFFSKTATVDVNGLVASTANIDNQKFMDGSLAFDKPGNPNAAIVNEGRITAKEAGLVGLVAPNVANSGIITAKLGRVHLASGDTATIDLYGDGLMEVKASDALTSQIVANSGSIVAEGGTIALTAAAGRETVNSVVHVTGELHAPSVGVKNGKIIIAAEGSNAVAGNVAADKGKKQGSSTVIVQDAILNASGRKTGERGGSVKITGDNVALLEGTIIDASGHTGLSGTTTGKAVSAARDGAAGGDIQIGGDYLGGGVTPTAKNLYVSEGALILADALQAGDAGRAIFWSDNDTAFYGNVYARARGGKDVDPLSWSAITGGNLGDGGFVETSGHTHLDVGGYVDLTASTGHRGTYFLDPTDITIYGNVDPSFVSTDGTSINLAASLKLWLDASDTSKVQLTYSTDGLSAATATGSSGGTTITTSANVASSLAVGARIRLGGTGSVTAASTLGSDTYTIASITGTTITLTSALTQNYSSSTLYRGLVSQMTDKSAAGNNAVQSTETNMPLWIANAVNGQGGVFYDNNNDALVTNSLSVQHLFLASNLITTDWNYLINLGAPFSFSNDFGIRSNGGNYPNPINSNDWSFNNGSLFLLNGESSAMGAWSLGNQLISAASQNIQTNVLTIGAGYPGRATGGYIYDTLGYNIQLNTQSRNLVDQYQSAKWGFALTPAGTGATEVAKATATDGYSVFTTRYLEKLSATADISLQASNNINLDLKGDTLNLSTAGRNITLTAGNQITTASSGGITTNNGNITFNGTNGVLFNNAFTLNAGTGAITINSTNSPITAIGALTLGSNSIFNAGAGTITANAISTAAGKNLTLTADGLVIGGNLTGNGNLTLQPYNASQSINLNNGTSGFYLTTAELNYIQAGWGLTTFGSTTSTAGLTAGALTLVNDTTLNGGTGTITTNAITMGAGKSLTLTADDATIGANLSGSGTLLIQPTTSTRLMRIGSSASSTLSLDNTEVGYFVDGWGSLVFGQSAGHYINIYTTSWYDPVTFRGFVNRIQGNIQGLDNASLSFSPSCCAEFHATGAVVSTAGNAINIPNGLAVYANNGSINSNGGAITIAGIGNMGTGFTGFTINTGGGALNVNGSIFQNAVPTTPGQYTFNSGSGTTTFTSAVQTSSSIAATAGSFVLSSNPWGSITALNNVSLVSANTNFTMPNLTSTGNVSLNAGTGTLTTRTIAMGSGNLSLTSDNLVLGGNLTGTGVLLLQPYTASRIFNINNGTGALYLSTAMLDYIQAGWSSLTFGSSSDSGLMTIGGYNWKNTVNFITGSGNIALTGTSTLASNASYNIFSTNGNVSSVAANTVQTSGTGSIILASGNDLTLTYGGQYSAAGTGSLLFQSNRDFIKNAWIDINTNGGTITINSDRDANGTGVINMQGYGQFQSLGGNITLGGGANPLTGYANGYSSIYDTGVRISGPTFDAGGGNIIINGTGWGNAGCSGNGCVGVFINNGAITTTGSGSITIRGIGGGTGATLYNQGVRLSNIDQNISTQNGDINIIGKLTGSAGATSVYFAGDTRLRTTGTGNINITAIANGVSDQGFGMNSAPTLVSGANITYIGDALNTSDFNGTLSAAGDIILRPYTAATTVGIGSGAGTLGITDNWLGKLNFGSNLWLGGYGNPGDVGYISNAGNMTINSTRSFPKNVNFLSAANVLSSGAGTITTTSAGNILLAALGDINLSTAQNFTASGTGSITERANGNIIHSGGGVDTTTGGALTLNADREADGSGAIALSASSNLASNGGAITLGGGITPSTVAAQGNTTYLQGISLGSMTINGGTNGNVILNGQGYGSGTASGVTTGEHGILLNAATVQTSGTGTMTSNGTGGGTGAGTGIGILLHNGSSVISTSGILNATGIGANGGDGINLSSTGINKFQVGAGNMSLNGTAALTGNRISFNSVSGGAFSGSGNVTLVATPGGSGTGIVNTASDTMGGASASGAINLLTDTISATTAPTIQTSGAITIRNYISGFGQSIGIAGASGTLQLTSAILNGISAGASSISIGKNNFDNLITANSYSWNAPVNFLTQNANIVLNGLQTMANNMGLTATNTGAAADIVLGAGSGVSTSGTGTVTLSAGRQITTTGAGSLASGSGNINLTAASGIALIYATPVTSTSGNITFNSPLTSTTSQTFNGGTGTISTNSMAVGTGNSLTLTADDLVIGGNLSGTGMLTLQPSSANRIVNINNGTADGTNFNLSTTEIGRLVDGWSNINIGNVGGGNTMNVGATNWTDPVTLRNNFRINLLGDFTGTGNSSFDAEGNASGWFNQYGAITTAGGSVTVNVPGNWDPWRIT